MTRRFTGGTWLLREHADPIGYERWRVVETEGVGRAYESDGGTTFPQPHETRVRVELDERDRLRALLVETQVEGEDAPRRLEAATEDDVFALVRREVAGATEEQLVPLAPFTFLDYPSPLLTTAMLRRLALDVGQGREFDAVLASPLSLELSRQRYGFERLPDEVVGTGVGEVEARAYRFASLSTRYRGRVWTDADGNVVKYEDSWDLVDGNPA